MDEKVSKTFEHEIIPPARLSRRERPSQSTTDINEVMRATNPANTPYRH